MTVTNHSKRHVLSLFYLTGAIIAVMTLLLLSPIAAAEELQHGAILSNACTACHSLDGNNISIGPNISSFKATELENILKEFRDGKRPSSLISRQAKIYTDAEIKIISGYIADE